MTSYHLLYLLLSEYIEQHDQSTLISSVWNILYIKQATRLTWSELSAVNIQAKASVSSFTDNNPNTQVKPNSGNKTTAALANALC